jgi:hypothetical protein
VLSSRALLNFTGFEVHLMQFQKVGVLALCVALPTSLFADYSYQQTTQITGGSIVTMMKMAGAFSSQARKAGEPVVSSIYIKDNRMANVSPDSTEIIDLDKETITQIDNIKKTYTVMTFAQIRQQIEAAREEMKKKQAEQPAPATPAPNPNQDNVKMSFDVKVRNTGAQKQVSGLDSKEAILTMTMNATDQTTQQTAAMAITNDMWMVPEIPGYTQVRDFYKRMAEKMGPVTAGIGMDMSKMLAQQPGATQALSDMGKEMQKLDGVPVMQVMRMGTTTDGKPLPAASEAPLPPSNSPTMPSGSDIAKQSAASMITSHIPFGGFGHKKQADPPPADQNSNQNPNAPPPTSAVLMESQTTITNFSSGPVDPSHFEVPAGFKQVQPQMEKH